MKAPEHGCTGWGYPAGGGGVWWFMLISGLVAMLPMGAWNPGTVMDLRPGERKIGKRVEEAVVRDDRLGTGIDLADRASEPETRTACQYEI